MENSTHEQKMQQIEAECAQLRKQILQLEFQHKKDVAKVNRNWDNFQKRLAEATVESEKRMKQTENHLRHLSKLTGIAFEELEDVDERLDTASASLASKRKKIE